MKQIAFVMMALAAIAITSGCTTYGKGKGKAPVVETNG